MNRIGIRGAALVLALIVVALIATLATAILERCDRWLELTRGRQDYAQALSLARSGIDYARAVLAEDARVSGVDQLEEAWATPMPRVQLEGNELSGSIEDQQGLWNLNNLARDGRPDPTALMVLQRLLGTLGLQPALANRIAVAVDMRSATPDLSRPGQWTGLTDLGNLRAESGLDAATLEHLRPYVTVLPGIQPVNLNTAPAPVLAALVPGLALPAAEALVTERKSDWYRDPADFKARLPHGLSPARVALSVNSRYFIAHATVQSGEALIHVSALIDRSDGHGLPDVIWQTLQ